MDDAAIEKLAAMIARASQPPVVNVNITMDAIKKKAKQPAVTSPATEAEPTPGGYPRPYPS